MHSIYISVLGLQLMGGALLVYGIVSSGNDGTKGENLLGDRIPTVMIGIGYEMNQT